MPENKKILLIESDDFYAKIVSGCLQHSGFKVLVATSGEEGLKDAASEQPDLILLSIKLPKKDGFEVLEELKAGPETKNIPVAMLSDLGAREDVCQCLKRGACNYFIKAHHQPQEVAQALKNLI